MSANPAYLVGLKDKGSIAVGKDADIIEFDPEASFSVDPRELFHKNQISPYQGKILKGVVNQTWLRGNTVYKDGAHVGGVQGKFLTRGVN